MPQCIIDLFEVVEVQTKNAESRSASGLGNSLLDAFRQQDTIREVREGVMTGHKRDLSLRPMLFGDIFAGRQPSAVRGRTVPHADGTAIAEVLEIAYDLRAR